MTADWSADKQAFPVPWGKAMMWIFLLSDTFIFTLLPDVVHERAHVDDGARGRTRARCSR